jgi:NAD(P)-dependent dehydrogenase (short-subunit alcohol dehydrogenase family)
MISKWATIAQSGRRNRAVVLMTGDRVFRRAEFACMSRDAIEVRMTRTERIFRLDEKVALITGGYGGIGAAVTRALAGAGARVAVAGHDGEKAAAFAAALGADGHDAFAATFDVLSIADTRRMVSEVGDRFGRLDILVNCVGLNREESAEGASEEKFDHVIDVNLKGAMFQAQAAARLMVAGGGGKQVHIGSVRSLLGLRGRGYAAYCASKGGLPILCKQLAAEWAPHRINVNVVAPTFVRTEQVAHMLADATFHDALVARIPLGRIAEPDDVAGAVLFFVAPASDFVTGQTLYLDGGITATQ